MRLKGLRSGLGIFRGGDMAQDQLCNLNKQAKDGENIHGSPELNGGAE